MFSAMQKKKKSTVFFYLFFLLHFYFLNNSFLFLIFFLSSPEWKGWTIQSAFLENDLLSFPPPAREWFGKAVPWTLG